MSLNPHTWLPTTTKQSVLVYALNVLLLLNLTVIVVMLTDTIEPTRDRASTPQPQAHDALDRHPVLLPKPAPTNEPIAASPANEPVLQTQVSSQPFVLANSPSEQTRPTKEKTDRPQPQPEPVQDDPPVTFFGIGLE